MSTAIISLALIAAAEHRGTVELHSYLREVEEYREACRDIDNDATLAPEQKTAMNKRLADVLDADYPAGTLVLGEHLDVLEITHHPKLIVQFGVPIKDVGRAAALGDDAKNDRHPGWRFIVVALNPPGDWSKLELQLQGMVFGRTTKPASQNTAVVEIESLHKP